MRHLIHQGGDEYVQNFWLIHAAVSEHQVGTVRHSLQRGRQAA
jgi:hypothetical protein